MRTEPLEEGRPERWSIETHCYLCGLAFSDIPPNRDHVPPRRIFPSAIRAGLIEPLLTLKTHPACQSAHARDEEYFFNSLLPAALQFSTVNQQLADDFRDLLGRDRVAQLLSQTVRRQFDVRPSGLVLPHGLIVQRVDGNRITRTAWKIVRGLFAADRGRFLPEDKARSIEIIGPFDRNIPDYVIPFIGRPRRGHSLACFGYTFTDSSEVKGWQEQAALHIWLLELWQTHLLYVAFHDPDCLCGRCTEGVPLTGV